MSELITLSEGALRIFPEDVTGPLVASVAVVPDAILGCFAWVSSLATFGHHDGSARMMQRSFRAVEFLPSLLFAYVIHINEKSGVKPFLGRTSSLSSYCWECYEKQEPNRLGLCVLLVKLVAARVLDALIGFVAAIASFCSLGFFERANQCAYRHLTGFFGIISDVATISVKFLNLGAADIYA